MTIPPWVTAFFKKLPKDFTGKLEIDCKGGGVSGIHKYDFWNQAIFQRRFKEEVKETADATESADVTVPPLRVVS